MKLILCLLMILSENATATDNKFISRNDIKLQKDEPAPFEGVLVEVPDYREDSLNEYLKNSCERELEFEKKNKTACEKCGDYDLKDVAETFFVGLAMGFAGYILITGGK